ncbi:MAG: dentilisin complex subunit PrcA [Treponema sp.]
MKKIVLPFMVLAFFTIFSCRNNQNEDSTLKKLVIRQGGELVKTISPVPTNCTIELEKDINKLNSVIIQAVPNSGSAVVHFGDSTENKRFEEYKTQVPSVVIKVKDGNSTTSYTVNIKGLNDEVKIKQLVIKQKDVVMKDLMDPIPGVVNVDLMNKVSATDKVKVEVKVKQEGAQVFFDADTTSNTTKEYVAFQKPIKVTIKSGTASKEYLINLNEPEAPVPQNYAVKCNVVDSIGGTNVKDADIKVYERGSTTEVKTGKTDAQGNAYLELVGNKYYDFVLSKKGSAASRVENVYVPEKEHVFLPMVMRRASKGALAIAPEISELTITHFGKTKALDPVQELDFDNNNGNVKSGTTIDITVVSKSKNIIPEEVTEVENYGIGINVGSPFSKNTIGLIQPQKNDTDNNIKIGADGVVTQKFYFIPKNLGLKNEETTLYIVVYDTAGNRCERQQRIVVKNSNAIKEDDFKRDRFQQLLAFSERYYRSLEVFGMPAEGDVETSERVYFWFSFSRELSPKRIDILRRPYQEGDIIENWEVVYTKQYNKDFSGNSKKIFKLSDDSGTLKEGETYQYKLEAYTSSGKITSNVATLRIMEAFHIMLTKPKKYSVMELNDLSKQDFEFTISNKALWNKEKADNFYFDILITADNANAEEGTTLDHYPNMVASKLKYCIGKQGKDALEVGRISGSNVQYRKYSEWAVNTTEVTDYVTYDNNTGTVTIKNKFLKEGEFNNATKKGIAERITKEGHYYWDIANFGVNFGQIRGNNPLLDDEGAYFTKEYPYLHSETGAPVGTEKAISYSFSNLKMGSGAMNGKSVFTVKQ